jgi:hypothetical protein
MVRSTAGVKARCVYLPPSARLPRLGCYPAGVYLLLFAPGSLEGRRAFVGPRLPEGERSGPVPIFDGMIRVRYSGPIRGAHMLSRDLSNDGFQAEFPPPLERRGAGQDAVHIMMEIGTAAKDGVVGYAAVEAVKRIVRTFKERYPGIETDVESSEGGQPANKRS